MLENEVETGQGGIGGTTLTEQQPSTKQAVRKVKAARTTASEAQASDKKATAINEVMTTIKNMTVLELAELVKTLETTFGVTAAAPVVATVATASASAGASAIAEEQTEFTVILKEVGANKISVIRAVRELTSLGLKESKDLVESAPKPVKEGVSKEEAIVAKQKLEAAGATVEMV